MLCMNSMLMIWNQAVISQFENGVFQWSVQSWAKVVSGILYILALLMQHKHCVDHIWESRDIALTTTHYINLWVYFLPIFFNPIDVNLIFLDPKMEL